MRAHKPRFGTQGQKGSGVRGEHNRKGGGAMGQPMGKKNQGPKPRFGAKGQPKAD